METKSVIAPASRSTVLVRSIAASLVALIGITGLSTPASAAASTALVSSDVTVSGGSNSLALLTGKPKVVSITSATTLLADGAVTTDSTNSDISIEESVNPVTGTATFNIVSSSATSEDAVITFSAAGRTDLVVNVTVTDPKLKSDALNLNLRPGSNQTVTITSDELGLPSDAEVTAVSSDSDLVTVTDAVIPASGSAVFTVRAASATSGTETITFQSLNYQDVVVNVSVLDAMSSADFVVANGVKSFSLKTGRAATLRISGSLTAVTTDSTNADITIQQSVNPVNGVATFNIVSSSATSEDAVVTFAAANRDDLVLNVSVVDPRLTAALEANVSNLNVRVGSYRTATITSDDLGLPSDAEVTAVSSDSDLVTVTDAVIPTSGSAAFRVNAVGLTSGTETITFQSLNYQDVVVNVTTFDDLKSSSFTDGQSGAKTLNLITGQSVTAQISSYLVLKNSEAVTTDSTNADITIEQSVNPVNGTATFNIVASSATSEAAVLTFSSAFSRTDLVVYVTVTDPKLKSNVSNLNIRAGSYQTATITSVELGLPSDAEVTAVSSDSDLVTVTDAVIPTSGSAAFRVNAVGLTSGTETITFQSLNYQDVVVNVTTFDDLKSSSFTDGQSGAKTLNLETGQPVTAQISAYLALGSTETVTVSSTKTGLTIQSSVNPVNGVATFNIASSTPGSGVLTFSAAGRTNLVVNVTVIVPVLASTDFVVANKTNSLSLKTGRSVTVQVSGSFTAIASDSTNSDISIEQSVNPVNGVATFHIVGSSSTSEDAVVTFSAAGRTDFVVNVTVTDPKLKSDTLNLTMRVGSYRTVTVTSDELGLPTDAEITAVSSDSDLITVTDAVIPTSGSAAFRVTAIGATSGTESITFQSLNYQDVVVNVDAYNGLSSVDLVSGANDSFSLSLKTGKAATLRISGAATSVTTDSTNSDITIEQTVDPVNGLATFNIVGSSATTEAAILTFSSGSNPDLVVSVTVTDPKLKSNVSDLNIRAGSYQTATITSVELGLPSDAEVTAVSSDSDLVTVTDAVTPLSGSAAFTVRAIGLTSGTETITFQSLNYQDVVVNVTTFDDLKSSSFTDGESGAKTLNLVSGESATAQISAYLELKSTQPVTVTSTKTGLTIQPSVNPVNGVATFNISSSTQGSGVLTFSAAGRTNLVVNVTVAQGFVTYATGDQDRLAGISLGETNTVVIGTTGSVEVTGLSNDPSVVRVVRVGNSANTFRVTGVSVGSANISFTAPGAQPLITEVGVTKADLAVAQTSYDLYTTQSVSFDVTSAAFPVGSDTTLVYTIDGSEVPEVEVGIVGATVTIKGLKTGNATVTISDNHANYVPVVIDVTVESPALSADASSYEVFYGQSGVITISSDELALTATDTVTVASLDEEVVLIADAVFVTGYGLRFPVKGLKAGSTTVTFSRDGFEPVTVTVSVEMPSLSADLDLSSIFVGDKATVVLTSDQQPISEEDLAMLTATASDGEVLSAGEATINADTNSATFEIEGLKAGSGSVTFSLENYEDATVQLAVSVPALKADVSSVKAFIGVPLAIEVSSDERPLTDAVVTAKTTTGLTITADTLNGECSGTNTGEGVAVGEVSTVSICAKAKGSYTLTITAEGYSPVLVRVVAIAPVLKSDVSKASLFVGEYGNIEISADEFELTGAQTITATSSVSGALTFDSNAVSAADGVAKFSYRANAAGVYKVVFSGSGFKPVTVSVNVAKPALVSGSTSIVVNNGGSVEFTVTSTEVDIPDTAMLTATVANTALGSVEVADPAAGEAVVTFTAASVGFSTITVIADNFKPVTVRISVLPARLELDVAEISTTVWGTSQIVVTSPDFTTFDPANIAANVLKAEVASATLLEDLSEPGKAVFEVKGLAKGSTSISFVASGFLTTKASVKVALASLSASTSTQQIFAGQSGTFTISSPDVELSDEMTLVAVAVGTGVEVGDIEFVDGAAVINFTGTEKGRAKITVTGAGFTKAATTVNVIQPGLLSNVSTVAFRADQSATIKISSTDLPLTDEVTLGFAGNDSLVTEVELVDGVATVKLTGPQILQKATFSLVVSAPNYKSKSIKVTVTPAPVCTAKSLGTIKFSDTDAKLSAAATTSIKNFASGLVSNNCLAVSLTSYVPQANTKVNAVNYAKEVALAASREAAVRTALTAEVTKLKGSVAVTIIRGVVPSTVLNGTAAAKSAYRRIDVASKVATMSARPAGR